MHQANKRLSPIRITAQRRQQAFTLVEVMIVCAIIGLLAAIAIPNYAKARSTAQRRVCIDNLRQLDSAKQQWALELGKSAGDPAPNASDVQPYVGRGSAGSLASVVCPNDNGGTTDSSYAIGDISTLPVCKIAGIAQQPDPFKAHVLP
jgi:prepilin-type N-terminal cleavage/methylation domain-containing protein